MAVKIDQVEALQETSTLLKEYGETILSATQNVDNKLQAKVDGQQAECINKYISIMNDLSSSVYVKFPNKIKQYGTFLSVYHGAITGCGFSTKIRSSKPGIDEDYCVKIDSTVIDKIEGEIDEIKKVITTIESDEVISGDISVEGINTSIGNAFDTCKNDLNQENMNIKKTRKTLQEANTKLITDLETVNEQLQECSSAIDTVIALSDLNPQTVLRLIAEEKFTPDNLEVYLTSVSKKDDVKAIQYLANDDYKNFFKLKSDNISDGVFFIAADKMKKRAFEENDEELTFEDIMNLMLQHADSGFANRLSIANEVMARQTAGILFALDNTDPDYAGLTNQFNQYRGLSNLFTGLYTLETESNTVSTGEYSPALRITFSMTNLTFSEDYNPSFELYKKIEGGVGEPFTKYAGIVTINEEGLAGSDLGKAVEEYQKKQKAKDEAVLKFVGNSLVTTVGIFNPVAGAGLGIVNEIAQGDYSRLSTRVAGKIENNKDIQKAGYSSYINASNKIMNDAIKLNLTLADAYKAEKDAVRNIINVLSGNSSIVISQSGEKGKTKVLPSIPSVENMRAIDELNTNGLKNYIDATDLGESFTEAMKPAREGGRDAPESETEKFFKGESSKTIDQLNPKELSDMLNQLSQISGSKYGIGNLTTWLSEGDYSKNGG